MYLTKLFKFGDEGGVRRFPLALNFLLSGSISALLILIRADVLPLIRAFNDSELSHWEMAILLPVSALIYMLFFVYLASTKAVLDWVLDGK